MIQVLRRRIYVVLASGLFLALALLVGSTAAQRQPSEADDASAQATGTLEERTNQRKQARQIQLDPTQQQHIQTHCQASQLHLSRVSDRILGTTIRRKQTYDSLISRLSGLSEKIQATQVATADYDKIVQELQSKVQAFYTTVDNLEIAVNDLANLDCQADPVGYQATLEEARSLRTQTVQNMSDVSNYLRSSLKPELQDIRNQVADWHGQEGHSDEEDE